MKIDDVIERIGFGCFHIRLIILACISALHSGIHHSIIVFHTYSPDHRCAIPNLKNDSFFPYDDVHNELINNSIPSGKDGVCNKYIIDHSTSYLAYEYSNQSAESHPKMERCDVWVFDDSMLSTTVVTEFNLVCDNGLKIAHSKTASLVGLLIGSLAFGVIGDRIGRKKSAFIGIILSLIGSIVLPFINEFNIFMLLRFIEGIGSSAQAINRAVVVVEYTEKSKRVFATFMMCVSYTIASSVMAGVAYFVRNWRYIQLFLNAPFVLMLSYFWLWPESARWLLSKGRRTEAESLLTAVASTNKVKLPKNFLDVDQDAVKTESIRNIFTTPVLLKRFIVMGVNWIAVCMVYHGLMFYSGNLGGNVFINFLAQTLIEIPSAVIVVLLMDRLGRKKLHVPCMLIGGTSCIMTLFPVIFGTKGRQALVLTLATIGKAAVAVSFSVIYIYTSEIFPTSLRMSALGASSCIARLGVIAAPYIAELRKIIGGQIGVAIPLIIFGGFTVFAGLLCILLPETKGQKLPDNVADVKSARWLPEDMEIELDLAESSPLTVEENQTHQEEHQFKSLHKNKDVVLNGVGNKTEDLKQVIS